MRNAFISMERLEKELCQKLKENGFPSPSTPVFGDMFWVGTRLMMFQREIDIEGYRHFEMLITTPYTDGFRITTVSDRAMEKAVYMPCLKTFILALGHEVSFTLWGHEFSAKIENDRIEERFTGYNALLVAANAWLAK